MFTQCVKECGNNVEMKIMYLVFTKRKFSSNIHIFCFCFSKWNSTVTKTIKKGTVIVKVNPTRMWLK